MDLQEIAAIGALIAAALVVPAGWIAYRAGRRERNTETFHRQLSLLQIGHVARSRRMLELSPRAWTLHDFPMFTQPDWIPDCPFDLDEIELAWEDTDYPDPTVDAARRAASTALPPLSPSGRHSYSDALTKVAGLDHLYNGTIYRLLDIDFSSATKLMRFSQGLYFDYLDTSEILAYEAVASRLQRYRKRLKTPFDLRNRVASLGIDTLTIRVDADSAGFFLHRRDPDRVVNNTNLLGVAPAGEFAPSDVSYESISNDLSLWRNVMREYAEEFLGVEEAQGRGGSWINFGADAPYSALAEGRAEGSVRVKVLGLGIDPLPWKPELLTVCLIDADCFDSIFENMLDVNDEGLLLKGDGQRGLPFDHATVTRYIGGRDMSPNARACLQLAWRHRRFLGLDT